MYAGDQASEGGAEGEEGEWASAGVSDSFLIQVGVWNQQNL